MTKTVTIVSILVGLAFLAAGGMKLSGPEQMIAEFERFGYPGWFMFFIGGAEAAGGIGLMVPKLRRWAALGLIIIMIGAVFSHGLHDPLVTAIPATVLGVLCAFIALKSPARPAI